MFSSMRAMIAAWATTAVVIIGVVIWTNGEYAAVQAQRAAMQPPAVTGTSVKDDKVVADINDEASAVAVEVAEDQIIDDDPCGGLPPEESTDPQTSGAEVMSDEPLDTVNEDSETTLTDTVLDTANDVASSAVAPDSSMPEAVKSKAYSLANWKLYSADVTLDPSLKPIAILITDLGLNAGRTRDAIDQLPKEVSLGISPYSHEISRWSTIILDHGNEFLLMLPMEPMRYPAHDPGPLGMLVGAPTDQNITRLDSILGSITGYIGMVNHMGSRMTADELSLTPVLQHLKDRGLIFVDSRTTAKSVAANVSDAIDLPYAVNSRYIDNERSEDAIMRQLNALEARAAKRGSALGIARLNTLSVATISSWAETLQSKGFQLVPVSAIVSE